jgi:leucyl aminopeptidase
MTGASRVAMGTELQSLFSNKAGLARRVQELSMGVQDPLWHMPLYRPYAKHLKSSLADLRNTGSAGR